MKKILVLAFLSLPVFAQPRIWPETTDPSAPAAGFQITYAKANFGLCTIDSGSTIKCPVVASGANAAKADALTTARLIYGASFDGTAAISGPITGTYGGTGINNGSSTITLGGSLTLSGAFTTTLTVTANTSVTLPTTGTLLANARSISTTSPLGGGGDLSADRTFTCTTCVVASSPGVGLAHFAGSTQTVTSSLVVNADITSGTIDLTAKVTGTLPLAQGGLGIASAPARAVYIPVAGCNNATAGASIDLPTANAPTPTCHGTTTTTATLDFADGANSKGTFELLLPTGWTGNEDITLDWYTASTSVSGKWTIETLCKAADGDMTSFSYNSAQTITTTSSSTANGLTRSTQTAVTITGCSAGNLQIVRIGRDVTDTSTAVHSLLGIELTLRVTPQT